MLSAGRLLVPSVLPANLTRMQANSQPSNEEEKKRARRDKEKREGDATDIESVLNPVNKKQSTKLKFHMTNATLTSFMLSYYRLCTVSF